MKNTINHKRYQVHSTYKEMRNCENCGRFVTVYAKLVDFEKKVYIRVGLDCAAKMTDRYTDNLAFNPDRILRQIAKKEKLAVEKYNKTRKYYNWSGQEISREQAIKNSKSTFR